MTPLLVSLFASLLLIFSLPHISPSPQALKSLKRLAVELSDHPACPEEVAARYGFPTFSMAGFPPGLEALRLSCRTKRVLLAGQFPQRLKLLALGGQLVLSPGMALPPYLLPCPASEPDAQLFKAADCPPELESF
jgi:hypothetical protein